MRLIDADVMLEELKDMEVIIAQQNIADLIDEQPTVDAVPVVRCHECIMHNNCTTEDAFKLCGIEDPFCCAGKRDEPVKPPEEAEDNFLMNRFLKVE